MFYNNNVIYYILSKTLKKKGGIDLTFKRKSFKNIVVAFVIVSILVIGAVPTHAALGDRLLRKGTRHNDVKVLQQRLKDLGFFHYKDTTTYYGNITEKAVKDFQRSKGLAVDGIFGPATFRALNSANKGSSSSKPSSPSRSGNLASSRLLRMGTRGQDVKNLQEALNRLGYNCGKADGIFGRATYNAVVSYQRAQGLSADGIAGPQTINAINGGKASNPTPKPPASKPTTTVPNRLLRMGSRGNDVKALQEALNRLGYNCGKADGIFGRATYNAVVSYQRAKGLSADGIAGPQTINAINGSNKAPSKPKPTTPDRGGSRNIGADIVNTAKKYLGVPYIFGGSSTSGFDCSGFTQFVYRQFGISIPRTSTAQASAGTQISRANLQPGDLVIFSDTYKSGPSHTGIYLRGNQFIHSSSSGKGVIISSLGTAYYNSRFSYGRRVY